MAFPQFASQTHNAAQAEQKKGVGHEPDKSQKAEQNDERLKAERQRKAPLTQRSGRTHRSTGQAREPR